MDALEKPRSNSTLKTLPEDRQADIAEYAQDHSLADTLTWLKVNGVDTSTGAISRFLSWYSVRRQLVQNKSAVQEVIRHLKEEDPDTTPEQLSALGEKFFLGLAIANRDPHAWWLAQQASCRKSELQLEFQKYHDQIQARKDAIQRELDTAKSSGGLSPETIDKIEKELNLF